MTVGIESQVLIMQLVICSTRKRLLQYGAIFRMTDKDLTNWPGSMLHLRFVIKKELCGIQNIKYNMTASTVVKTATSVSPYRN